MNKRKLAPILSAFIWGSGQFFLCKQRIKGLIFFLIQFLVIGIELISGYWPEYFAGMIPDFNIRIYGGFFTRGIWGLRTLGEVPGVEGGDHSTLLMVNGIIVLLILIIVGLIYIWNIVDAYRTAKRVEETQQYITSKQYAKRLYQKSFAYIILAPIGILVLFVNFMPILFAFLTAFTNYNRDHLPPANLLDWVGFSNFAKLLKVPVWTSTFLQVLIWTLVWSVVATFSTYFLGMFQAMLLNSKCVKFKSIYRGIMILPWAIPQMISLLVFKNLLNSQFGPLNQFLLNIGLIHERIPFLTDPFVARITVIVVNLWLGFPMYMIMIQGVLSNIDHSLIEAAEIDGAGTIKVFTKITLPLVSKATAPLVVMNLAANFNGFGSIFFLTDGGPTNASLQFAGDTDILISWIYKLTLNQQIYDMAAVMSIILFIFIGSISFWNFRRTRAFKEVDD